MDWKRLVNAFLLGAGLSVIGGGCAAVDALVSSPAGHGANASSPERLVAIGRVFENQGRMTQAQAMYRQALRAQPRNVVAQERMDFIASVQSGRTFDPAELRAREAVALADSLQGQKQIRNSRSNVRAAAKTVLKEALDNESIIASLDPSQQAAPEEQATADAESYTESGSVQLVDTGWELAELEETRNDNSETSPLKTVPAAKTTDIETLGFEGGDDQEVQIVNISRSEWKANTQSVVTLDELVGWIDTPVENRDNFVRAMRNGADDGVKAMAATMLIECPLGDDGVNSALSDACASDSEVLRVSARDALIQRGAIDSPAVDDLISLLASEEDEIRAQAAASLRNCAGTEWAARCVAGLTQLLNDDQTMIVAVAASTLGDFGADAGESTDRLEELLQSQDSMIIEAAEVSLNRIRSGKPTRKSVNLPPADLNTSASADDEYLPVVE